MTTPLSFLNLFNSRASRQSQPKRRSRSRARLIPFIEHLEVKIAPATFTWTGLGSNNNWNVSQNWTRVGLPANPIPTSSSDILVFPAGAARMTSVNNLGGEEGGSTFASVQIQASGYNISGSSLTLSTGVSYSGSGLSTYSINTTLTGQQNAINVQSGSLACTGRITLGNSPTFMVASGAQVTLSGGISQSGSRAVTKAGSGLMILNSTGTYTGATTISGGTLQVDGSSSSSAVTINAGALLCGTGTVGVVQSIGGTVGAGDVPSGVGTLKVAGLTLDAASAFTADLVSASSYDSVISSGPVNLGGAALVLSGGYTATSSDRLILIKNSPGTAIVNTFASLAEDSVVGVGNGTFRISYTYNNGTSANNVALKGLSATTTTLTVPSSNPTYGQSITFTTNVSAGGSIPTPGTTVELFVDSARLQTSTIDASGNATFSVPSLTASGHTVYVKYLGDNLYAPSQSSSSSLMVNPAPLTATGITANNKVYDATVTATINTASAALSGVLGSDVVTLVTAGATGVFVSKGVGTGKNVVVSGLVIGGADAGNYTLTQPIVTANITAAQLTVSSITATNKIYDATTTATINTSAAALSGVLGLDSVTLNTGGVFGAFNTNGVGTSKPVTVSGLALSGVDSGNYILTQPTTTANISAKLLVGSITADNKEYDETTAATIATRSLNGVVPGDTVNYVGGTASFASFNVGTNIPVTATGLTLAGADAANYTVNSSASTTADILLRTLTITADAIHQGLRPDRDLHGHRVHHPGAARRRHGG